VTVHPCTKIGGQGREGIQGESEDFRRTMAHEGSKKITATVDVKANKALTLHKQVMSFFTIRQGFGESDDDYLLGFNSCFRNMEMAGGEHFMCSPQLLGKELAKANDDEIKEEAEKFKAMCFILWSDERRYNGFLEGLRKRSFLGCDEYPVTVTDAYNLLIRTSQ